MKELIYPFALSAVRYFVAAYGGAHLVRDGVEDQMAGSVTIAVCVLISWFERWWNNRKLKQP